jgi:hypothetical protein
VQNNEGYEERKQRGGDKRNHPFRSKNEGKSAVLIPTDL